MELKYTYGTYDLFVDVREEDQGPPGSVAVFQSCCTATHHVPPTAVSIYLKNGF